uniref:Uncharacterized protein n=1 Tax=Arion vulgaris TaxID=1028688 RepID=A0A0B7B1I8_9EUPU
MWLYRLQFHASLVASAFEEVGLDQICKLCPCLLFFKVSLFGNDVFNFSVG